MQQRSVTTSASAAKQPKVAVIGGGIAGLSAAARLADLGIPSTVLDMGTRTVGGRMCSRNLSETNGGYFFDHGAQFLAPVSDLFASEVQNWTKHGAAVPWQGQFGALNAHTLEFTPVSELREGFRPEISGFCGIFSHFQRENSIFVGAPSMGSVCGHLAERVKATGSHVSIDHKVTGLHWDALTRRWTVEGVPRTSGSAISTNFGVFEAVIIADALIALPDSAGYATGLDSTPEVQSLCEKIQSVRHDPVFTLMVAFEAPLDSHAVPFDAAAVVAVEEEDSASSSRTERNGFQWIARNSSKPGRRTKTKQQQHECWVAITTAEKARELLLRYPLHTSKGVYNPQTAGYRDAVAKELLGEFLETIKQNNRRSEIELPAVAYCHAQRWGRGFVQTPLDVACLKSEDAMFAAAGDFCSGLKLENSERQGGSGIMMTPIEAAWLSGRHAADAIASWVSRE